MIKKLYQRLRTTTVYVTHDQVEAMTIGETLVVLKDGRIHQVGSPAECYLHPQDTFVASFLGSPPMNLLEGTFVSAEHSLILENRSRLRLTPRLSDRVARSQGARVTLGVRPEDLTVGALGARPGPMTLDGKVVSMETLGHEVLAHVDIGGEEVVLRGKPGAFAPNGERVSLVLREEAVHLFAGEDGRRLEGSGNAGEDSRSSGG
jgi:ABC-type sugar transport system ATPase subunit